jgi:hypothetical protein
MTLHCKKQNEAAVFLYEAKTGKPEVTVSSNVSP